MIKSIQLGLIAMCVLTTGTLSAQQNEPRIPSRGIAAQSSEGNFAPYEFSRHAVGDNEIQIETLYAGICHSDIIMCIAIGAKRNIRWFPVTKLQVV